MKVYAFWHTELRMQPDIFLYKKNNMAVTDSQCLPCF